MTAVERFGDFGGYRTRYLEAGDPSAESVLLLHDGAWGGCSTVTWGGVIPYLSDEYHVLAPDMLGFGGTDKAVFFDRAPFAPRVEHIKAFIAALRPGIEPHVVGTSFGGTVALRWLAAGGELRSVTALSGTGGPWRTQLSVEGLRGWDGTREDMERLVGLLIDRGPGFDDRVDERFRWASAPGHYRAMAAVAVPVPAALAGERVDDPWPQQLSGTAVPLHVIEGNRDELLEPGWTRHIAAVRPDALVTVGEFRHSPNLDEPEKMAAVIARGLKRDASA